MTLPAVPPAAGATTPRAGAADGVPGWGAVTSGAFDAGVDGRIGSTRDCRLAPEGVSGGRDARAGEASGFGATDAGATGAAGAATGFCTTAAGAAAGFCTTGEGPGAGSAAAGPPAGWAVRDGPVTGGP